MSKELVKEANVRVAKRWIAYKARHGKEIGCSLSGPINDEISVVVFSGKSTVIVFQSTSRMECVEVHRELHEYIANLPI